MITLIPLNKLVGSKANVRRVATDVAPLAASIASEGLLQNLVVTEAGRGRYAVIAGERRRRAACLLVEQGIWPNDQPIPCEVRDGAQTTAVSLAENVMRIAMHPADAYRAFAALEAEGVDENAISNRFGCSIADVRRFLMLGRLSPKVLKLLADDKISLETAQALTLAPDHPSQEEVAKHCRGAGDARRMLTEAKIATSNRLFIFVGATPYEGAGGGYTQDLFAAGDNAYADDGALVRRLAAARLEAIAEEARSAGWSEVIAAESEPPQVYSWYRIHPAETREPTATEAAELAAAQAEIERIRDDAAGRDLLDDEYTAVRGHQQNISRIRQSLLSYSAEQQEGATLVCSIGYDGELLAKAYTAGATKRGQTGEQTSERPVYAAALVEDLSKVRTIALQRELCAQPEVAIDLLTDALLGLVGHRFGGSHPIRLRREPFHLEPSESANAKSLAPPEEVMAMLLSEVPETSIERFAWLCTQDAETKRKLLGYAAAVLVDGVETNFVDRARIAMASAAAEAVGLDMRDHWYGGAAFFERLTKRAMLQALEESLGAEVAKASEKMTKGDLAATCAERLAGTGWLPPVLRSASAVNEGQELKQAA